jgi:hypothetical protein
MGSEIGSTPSAQGEPDDNTQLDKAGQTILELLNRAADVGEQNSRHAIDAAQRLSHQFEPLRIASPSSSPRLKHTGGKQSAPSNCFTKSTPRLRIDFSGEVTIVATHQRDRNAQPGANDLAQAACCDRRWLGLFIMWQSGSVSPGDHA